MEDRGFKGLDADFSVQDIDDKAIASSIEGVFADGEFQKFVDDVTNIVRNEPEEGRILESDLNDYVGGDNLRRLEENNIPADAEASLPADDYEIAELEFKRQLAIYFALSKEYKRLTGRNFTANSFKGDEVRTTQTESPYGNLSGNEAVMDEPKTINGMVVDDNIVASLDDNLVRILKDVKELIPFMEVRRMQHKTTPTIGSN